MNKKPRILWLEGIFDERTIGAFPASSQAVNFWHLGFVRALGVAECEVTLIGHPYDRVWPAGRVIVSAHEATLAPGFSGRTIGYINVPLLRQWTQSFNYLRQIKAFVAAHGLPDFVFTFNDTPASPAAKYLSREFGVPWIYIAGDGPALAGANGYLYQNWVYYKSPSAPGPKIHLDGGLPALDAIVSDSTERSSKAIMYMGALTEHGGALELARAFHRLSDPDFELWITGRGKNVELEQLAASDIRIKLYGFVGQDELHRLASRAWIFVNPRPTTFVPNKLNYPSKLLHYLSYGRPVLSTFTEGLSPDYREALILIGDETEMGLARAICDALSMSDSEYQVWCERVARFNITRTWERQVGRLLNWLDAEFK